MDRGAWWATVHGGHKELDTTEGLSTLWWEMGLQQTCSPAACPYPSTKDLLAPVLAIAGLKQGGRLAPSPGSSQDLSGEGLGPSGFFETPCRASFGKRMRNEEPAERAEFTREGSELSYCPSTTALKWGAGVGLGDRRLSARAQGGGPAR